MQCTIITINTDCHRMYATKLVLNAISTSAHVLNGMVLHNRMINVRVANDKLFYRSIGMIEQFGNVNFETARECLLRSIYYQSNDWKKHEKDLVSDHIKAAFMQDKIVPVGILLASQISQKVAKQSTVQEIRAILAKEPSVRRCLQQFIQ